MNRLASEAEMSPSVVMRLEKGTAPVNVATLLRYARVLGVTVKALFDFAWDDDES